jgi:hypothetical protein
MPSGKTKYICNGSITRKDDKMTKIIRIPNGPACPFAPGKIDGRAARLVAFHVLVALLIGLVYPIAFWIALILSVDFALRSSSYRTFSVFRFVSRMELKVLSVQPKLENLAPKQFAARIGLIFSLGWALASWLGLSHLALGIVGIFALCAALEAFWGFCLGCKAYSGLIRVGLFH